MEMDLKERVRSADEAVDRWVADARSEAASRPSPEADRALKRRLAVSRAYRSEMMEMARNWFLLSMAIAKDPSTEYY